MNLPDAPAAPDTVFIKDYGENAGILAALLGAGIVEPTDRTVPSGYVDILACELRPPFREACPADRVNDGGRRGDRSI